MSWTDADVDHVEATLQSDGYALIFGLMQDAELRLIDALCKKSTTWEETLRLRGELDAVRRFAPARIRQNYPSKSEKP